jgi:hypothetical protein
MPIHEVLYDEEKRIAIKRCVDGEIRRATEDQPDRPRDPYLTRSIPLIPTLTGSAEAPDHSPLHRIIVAAALDHVSVTDVWPDGRHETSSVYGSAIDDITVTDSSGRVKGFRYTEPQTTTEVYAASSQPVSTMTP